ncbi:MAG TPA: metal-dependent phosphohydrolase [Streptosporangiaceae bacterium]|nr:metal-dependent phosphohydrolase [Streptosporangiaceae bacterium]
MSSRAGDAMGLIDRWAALAGPDTRRLGSELIARYAEPHRRYHTGDHLVAVLDLVDELTEPPGPGGVAAEADLDADADAIRLAAWFHDAVYDPARADNEERSARLAERMLADTDLAAPTVREVARLVRLTETHDPAAGDRAGEVLCDADLAVLAGEPAAYAAYAAAVREEYGFVPDDAFARGRAQVLRGLLARPAIFRTARAHERFEAAARHNIATELTLLSTGPSALE